VLSIPEAGSFPAGSADMAVSAEQYMARLAAALHGTPNAVRVEGHTDDVPINNERFTSNWELSTARATRVVEFLVGQGVAPDRLSAAGYSEFHPRSANESAPGRARNRRVDIVILNSDTRQSEEPAGIVP
jgi:chemotaxis protein MotB